MPEVRVAVEAERVYRHAEECVVHWDQENVDIVAWGGVSPIGSTLRWWCPVKCSSSVAHDSG